MAKSVTFNTFREQVAALAQHDGWRCMLNMNTLNAPTRVEAMSALVDAVQKMGEAGYSSSLKNLFVYVEECQTTGEEDLQTSLCCDFIEGLINASPRRIRSEWFVGYFGPKSRLFAIEWCRFTGNLLPGLEDNKPSC